MNTQELPREDIARLAYQLWEERGCPIGSPELDWERAEKALMQEASSDAGSRADLAQDDDVSSVEGLDVSAQQTDSGAALGAAPKASRRSPRSGRVNEAPRRSTQVR